LRWHDVGVWSFKKPKRIEFVIELPKNAYGKVLRRDLRDRFDCRR
jgi:long-chain acyl-CoA synthetase